MSQLFPREDYGYIETPEKREVYSHRHSVLHEAFDRLQAGAEVTFVRRKGEKGTPASTVKLVGRHHLL